jgi:cation diffusion facilitator family transporter
VILDKAWDAYRTPSPLAAPQLGLMLNAVSTVLNLLWALFLLRRGTALRSAALRGDGKHLIADVVTSVGVLFGVGMVILTGLRWLDPAVAAITALYVLFSGIRLIEGSVGGLMDAAPADEIIGRVRRLVADHAEGALEAHDLRMRQAGRLTFLEFHLVVPGSMTVSAAHDICDRVEAALKAEVQGLMITIHVEPDSKAKHHGIVVV